MAKTPRRKDYDKQKKRARARIAELTRAGQELPPLPAVVDPSRRAAADGSFRRFCESYFEHLFTLDWSQDHLKVLEKIERVVRSYETLAVAMPRGSGKTTLCMVAVIWAILTGLHKFVYLIGNSEEAALSTLANIKNHLRSNDTLLADYPEAIFPIRQLEGESRRCAGQRYYGVPTQIGWGKDEVVMPTIPGSRCAGSIVRVSGIHGNIRGAVHVRPDGTQVRPTLAICDDPQTDASARSLLQTDDRLNIVKGAVWNLAGPGERTAIIIPCTVIREDDLADRLLDRQANPVWRGERTKLLYGEPANEKLWEKYAEIRSDSFRGGGDCAPATAFYIKHRKAMDKGMRAAWPQRYNTRAGEASAIQHAMNLKFDDESAFYAEYQNEPTSERGDAENLTLEQLESAVRQVPRGVVPGWCDTLTAAVDIHDDILFYVVTAWDRNSFAGHVVGYGAWPDQGSPEFRQGSARKPLWQQYPGRGKEAAIRAGLDYLAGDILAMDYRGQDGSSHQVAKVLVDSGYMQELIFQACSESNTRVVRPSRGIALGAKHRPFGDVKRSKSRREVVGDHWREGNIEKYRSVRRITYEANHWKTFVRARLQTPTGDAGALSIFKPERKTGHMLFFEHLLAEKGVPVEAAGRKVTEWANAVDRDNHWWDCLVYTAVAASLDGVQMRGVTGEVDGRKVRKPRLKLSELQKRKVR